MTCRTRTHAVKATPADSLTMSEEPVNGFTHKGERITHPEDLGSIARTPDLEEFDDGAPPRRRVRRQGKLPVGEAKPRQQVIHVAPPPAAAHAGAVTKHRLHPFSPCRRE